MTPSREGPGGRAARPGPRLLAVAAVMGLAELGLATVIPLLPLYLKERLGASATLVGVVVGTFAAVETVLKTVWGSLADRIGRRPVVLTGLLLCSTAPLLMTLLRVPGWFVPLRVVDGAGSAALWPCAAAAVAEEAGVSSRAAAMGILNMFFLAGLALGPSLGLFVSAAFGTYHAGFYLASGLLLAAAGTAAAVFRDGPSATRGASAGQEEASWGPAVPFLLLRRAPMLVAMLGVAFVQMIGVGLLAPILVIYAREVVGMTDQAIGAVFLAVVLSVALASVPGGRLADRIGRPRAVVWGMAAASAGMWLVPSAGRGHVVLLGVAIILLGASYAISSPAWLALMSEVAPRGSAGLVMGASETAQGAGLVIGPVLGGILYDTVGPRAPFVGSALLLTAGTWLALRALGRGPRGPRPSDPAGDAPGHVVR